jgi:hypothetical protein
LESTSDQGLYITFPTFKSKAIIGHSNIYLDATPYLADSNSSFQDHPVSSTFDASSPLVAKLQSGIQQETAKLDNLLLDLHRYYNEFKMKRQLKMEVPAGFRHLTSSQRQFVSKTPPRNSSLTIIDDIFLSDITSDDTVVTSNTSTDTLFPTSSVDPTFIPIARFVDKVSSSLPSTTSIDEFVQL